MCGECVGYADTRVIDWKSVVSWIAETLNKKESEVWQGISCHSIWMILYEEFISLRLHDTIHIVVEYLADPEVFIRALEKSLWIPIRHDLLSHTCSTGL